MAKVDIIPAILPMDFAELEEKVSLVESFAKVIQIDVCDGQFVPNATWPYRKRDDSFEKIVREEMGLPGWENVNFEIDLMANRPAEKIEDWVRAGASRIILHAESKDMNPDVAKSLEGRVEIGLALNEDTPLEAIGQYMGIVDFIQFMGIDNIGFQHQPFDDRVIARVRDARSKYPELVISVDGGVNLDNAPQLISAGANRLVVGSAIFNAENPIDAVEKFMQLA